MILIKNEISVVADTNVDWTHRKSRQSRKVINVQKELPQSLGHTYLENCKRQQKSLTTLTKIVI